MLGNTTHIFCPDWDHRGTYDPDYAYLYFSPQPPSTISPDVMISMAYLKPQFWQKKKKI